MKSKLVYLALQEMVHPNLIGSRYPDRPIRYMESTVSVKKSDTNMAAPITSHFKGIWIRPTPPIWKSNMVSSIRNRDPPRKLHLAKMGRVWTIWESTLTKTNWMRIWCLLEVSRNYQVVARQLISNTSCNSNRQMFPQMTSLRVKWNGVREIKKWTKLGFKAR